VTARTPHHARLYCISVALLIANAGCQTAHYYGQAIGGQWQLSSKKQPITRVISQTPSGEPLRERLQQVQEIVAFAEYHLGLPSKGAYQDYTDIDRPYVVWNVLAAPEFSLEAHTWWYPIVGSLEYRGYFKKEQAIKIGDQLRQEGMDVHIGGVTAYSTLGFFNDPVLSTFVDDPVEDLAELLFHELAHHQLFYSGDTDFNEAFATAVGREGVRRWLLSKGDATGHQRYLQRRRRDDQVIAMILKTRGQLEELYRKPIAIEAMRKQKAKITASLRNDYRRQKNSWPGYRTFDNFMAAPINNARLNGVDTYYELVPKFESLLTAVTGPDDNFSAFIDRIKTTGRMSKTERRSFLFDAVDQREQASHFRSATARSH